MGLKLSAVFRNFAHRCEAENLITAAVGQNRPVPPDKMMQAAQLANQLRARPQVEMVRIREHDLATEFLQIFRQHRFHRALRADRHKGGSFHDTVSGQ